MVVAWVDIRGSASGNGVLAGIGQSMAKTRIAMCPYKVTKANHGVPY